MLANPFNLIQECLANNPSVLAIVQGTPSLAFRERVRDFHAKERNAAEGVPYNSIGKPAVAP